jgi:hypothetical protein
MRECAGRGAAPAAMRSQRHKAGGFGASTQAMAAAGRSKQSESQTGHAHTDSQPGPAPPTLAPPSLAPPTCVGAVGGRDAAPQPVAHSTKGRPERRRHALSSAQLPFHGHAHWGHQAWRRPRCHSFAGWLLLLLLAAQPPCCWPAAWGAATSTAAAAGDSPPLAVACVAGLAAAATLAAA